MATSPIRFGTDGWRGRIAEDYTFSAVRRCAHGFALYLRGLKGASGPVVVGYDKRFASEHFAAAAAEVLAGNGLKVLLTDGPTPTPAIAFSVVDHAAQAAVNITASHNPAWDNGFKVRDLHGGAIDPDGLARIESGIPESDAEIPRLPLAEGFRQGSITLFDPAPAYARQLEKLVDLGPIRARGLTVVVDSMWGNGAGWFARLLGGGATRVVEIHKDRNPVFPEMTRPEPIPPNIDVGLRTVVEHGADALLVTDGDADRVGFGDEQGQFVDQLRVFALLAFYLLEVRGERGPIVKTLSTTSMLDKLGALYKVPVVETGVGFKYVAPKFIEVNALIGGEESGGYAFRGHVPERDGILSGLFLLDLMVRLKSRPSELIRLLFDRVGPHYYDRVDSPLPPDQRAAFEDRIRAASPARIGGFGVLEIQRKDGTKFLLEDGGWLLVRFSGTEPLVRVYCETTSAERVQPILQDGLRLVGVR
jgi:phosphomannomutase